MVKYVPIPKEIRESLKTILGKSDQAISFINQCHNLIILEHRKHHFVGMFRNPSEREKDIVALKRAAEMMNKALIPFASPLELRFSGEETPNVNKLDVYLWESLSLKYEEVKPSKPNPNVAWCTTIKEILKPIPSVCDEMIKDLPKKQGNEPAGKNRIKKFEIDVIRCYIESYGHLPGVTRNGPFMRAMEIIYKLTKYDEAIGNGFERMKAAKESYLINSGLSIEEIEKLAAKNNPRAHPRKKK